MTTLQPGLKGETKAIVGDRDLASALGSGDVPVLGTPRMIALAEAATVKAVAQSLEPGQTSVGTRVDMRHLTASPHGRSITATAELRQVDGRSLRFDVAVFDDHELVANGTVERIVVDRQSFIDRANRER